MPIHRCSVAIIARLGVILLLLTVAAFGATEKVVYSFMGSGGSEPNGGLIFDAAGNLYGTTQRGGSGACISGCGVVFELSPSSSGYTEKILHTFGGVYGENPKAGVVFDAAGNLYGTTLSGGVYGFGTVYELTPGATGWTWHGLHNFTGGPDGGYPTAGVILDSAGNVYGATTSGGGDGSGVAFELIAASDWTEQVLCDFNYLEGTGASPLIFDAAGNLYGTAANGGYHENHHDGTVYKLSLTSSGKWVSTVLYAFQGPFRDGSKPGGGVVFDSAGNLYGATQGGGATLSGSIFLLSPPTWVRTEIAGFGGGNGGYVPASPTLDSAGYVYSTTFGGGSTGLDAGTVFKLGVRRETYIFGSIPFDGRGPQPGLAFDALGNVYGATAYGGGMGQGAIFEVTF